MKSRAKGIANSNAVIMIIAVISAMFAFVVSGHAVRAGELDGYTTVDWSWNRDVETTDSNSVIVGGNIVFWRYVNKENPTANAIWKSAYGDELSDEDVTSIWNGDFGEKYILASADVDSIADENIRNYIKEHVDEDVPELKLKFDIDSDVPGDTNQKKADKLFNGDIGYRVYRDGDSCRIEMKFSPKFRLKEGNIKDENNQLPYMPYKPLPRACYPYSSVLFSMWGFEGGSDDHYGALEVIEGNDPRYIYGKSFGYGDILEKGKIPNNMEYPNFEAGKINEEGNWAGQVEADTLDSNLVRIGQQYKSAGDLWYYSYGGAVGYNFKFPFKVSLAVDITPKVTKRIINSATGDIIYSNTDVFEKDTESKMYRLADDNGYAIIDNNPDAVYVYDHCEIKRGDNEELINKDTAASVNISFRDDIKHKILDIYVNPFPIQSQLKIRYVDKETGENISEDSIPGKQLIEPEDTDTIEYHIKDISCKGIEDYVIEDMGGNIETTVNNPTNKDVSVTVTGAKPIKVLIIHLYDTCDDNPDDYETIPIDPSICDSDTSTITWQEQISHRYTRNDYTYTCYHTYTYRAKLNIDDVELSPLIIKSGYGLDADLKVSVSWQQIDAEKSTDECPSSLGIRACENRPTPPTKVTARLGWTSKTFDGQFIQGSMVNMNRVSRTNTTASFSAPHNDVVGENKLYTDLWLSGTKEQPRRHKIAFDIYGGGVDGTEWCTTVEKVFTVNGDMYEDAGTTST